MTLPSVRTQHFARGRYFKPFRHGLTGLDTFWTTHKSVNFLQKRARNIGSAILGSKRFLPKPTSIASSTRPARRVLKAAQVSRSRPTQRSKSASHSSQSGAKPLPSKLLARNISPFYPQPWLRSLYTILPFPSKCSRTHRETMAVARASVEKLKVTNLRPASGHHEILLYPGACPFAPAPCFLRPCSDPPLTGLGRRTELGRRKDATGVEKEGQRRRGIHQQSP